MPLCPGLYPGGTSVCSCPLLCDQWARAVVTGPVWQIDHDESQGWKPASVTAGPGQVQDDAGSGKTESTVDSPGLAPSPPPISSLQALPASVILPANLIPDQRPGRKKREERGGREVKRVREIDMYVAERVERESNKPSFIWRGRQLLGLGHLCVCRLTGLCQAPPQSPLVPNSWKVAMATPLGQGLK